VSLLTRKPSRRGQANILARKRHGGAALIGLAAILVLGISWMLVSRLSSANRVAADRGQNARVLADAKAALLGWVATNALDSAESNPGRLPCPQAWGDVGDPTNEGRAAANCSAPAAGWLPWRTLGLPKLLDASGQQLWYVVSPGWHFAGASLILNSNTPGQLTLDGAPMVALIIAPGAALSLAPNANQVATGCAARSQSQALSLPTPPNPLDFLECQNGTTADQTFTASVVDNGTNRVFNDQVVGVAAADVLPGLEAAISKRIERDIVPTLKAVYSGTEWEESAIAPKVSPAAPAFAFAAPWASPGTSTFRGAAGTFQGLLPFSYSEGCSPLTDARCTTTFVAWDSAVSPNLQRLGGTANLTGETCTFPTAATVQCDGQYVGTGTLQLLMTPRARNVTMTLRKLDTAATDVTTQVRVAGTYVAITPTSKSAAGALRTNGSSNISINVALPSRSNGTLFRITANIAMLADHPVLKPNNATTGWFVRNEWYRLVYYAIAPDHAPSGAAPRICTDAGLTCLQVANVATANKRSILILAGRSLTGVARPNGTLTDFVEGLNSDLPSNLIFEQRTVSKSFNDRVVVLDAPPPP
jgi:hypothetical protein